MFYAHYVLAKKGPLARIWLAAHWDKKLTKAHVFETNIEKSVDGILQPKVKMALRTSGHLLLGVVRIYSRKAKYLLADCNEAFVKIKMAFRPGMVDLPEDNREAAINAITLPEVFHDFDTAMPELNDVDIEAQLTLNQSRAEEITLREDYGNMSSLVEQEEGFGDMGFGADGPDILRHASRLEQSLDQANLLFSEGVDQLEKDKEPQPSTSAGVIDRPQLDIDPTTDGFPANLSNDIIGGGLFGEGGLFDDTPMQVAPVEESVPVVPTPHVRSDDEDDDDDRYGGHPSPSHSSVAGGTSPARSAMSPGPGIEEPGPVAPPQSMEPEIEAAVAPEEPPPATPQPPEQTLLLHNDEETFALGPVDASALRGSTKTKRKRKLIVDEVKNISGEEMKAQLSDTSDIVTSLDLAPPTKRLMHWKETGGVEKLFALPGRNIPARFLFKTYQRHLTSRAVPNEDGVPEADPMLLEGEIQDQPGTLAASRRTRKRKHLAEIEEEEKQVELEEMPPPMSVQPPMSVLQPPMSVQPPPSVEPPMSVAPPLEPPTVSDELPMPVGGPMSVGPMSVGPMSVGPMSVGPPQLEDERMLNDSAQAPPNMTPFSQISELHLPASDQLKMIEESLRSERDPTGNITFPGDMANMGYDDAHPPPTTPGAVSERGAPTPWNEDYDFPVSVGPPEEQATDETFEQFEERVLNKRAAQMYHLMKSKLEQAQSRIPFSLFTVRNNRKQVAQKFYSVLMLKKFQVVELEQESSYAEIYIEKGINFTNPTL